MSTNQGNQLQPATGAINAPVTMPKYTIQAVLKGFPVAVELTGKAEALTSIVDRLIEIGATPPRSIAPTVSADASTETPTCPQHHAKMKESRKPGVWYCPKKDGDDYCDYKVKR